MKMKKISKVPVAKRIPEILEKHGDRRTDYYYWLRERKNPNVIAYLEEENRYFDRVTEPLEPFRQELFRELKARIKDEDESVPYRYEEYFYQTKYPAGKDFPVFLRWKEGGEKRIFFDANERAEGHDFYQYGSLKFSPDDRYLAFSEDFKGRRQYAIRIKDFNSGTLLPEVIENTTGQIVWQEDGKAFYYVRKNPVTLRSEKVFKHYIGTNPEEDKLIYEETDEEYDVYVSKSKTRKYIYLVSSANTSTEYRYKPAGTDADDFKLMMPKRKNIEYYPYHIKDNRFLVVTNDQAENFRIVHAELQEGLSLKNDFLPHRSDTLIEEIDIFNNFLAVTERRNGLTKIRILDYGKKTDYYIDFPEETYTVYIGTNPEMKAKRLRYVYNSLTTPASVMEIDMASRETQVLKEDEIPDGRFDKENYRSERLWAPGRDGTIIPVSLVWHKKIDPLAGNPLLLYGYGSYGITIDDNFSKSRLSLLDRGFIFAIAHIRGGEYLGRKWYEEGKLLKKKNTFYDFIDVARFLIDKGYTSPGNLYAMGGSAGGLLMGAVMNMAPELFRGIVAQVPFVDVLTTMLDETIPLTTGEYEEWGNPNEKVYYDYIKSYSPYDNVEAKAYPNLLVTTGFHDSQVQYWEPAKWVAKLRYLKTDDNLTLLYTDMKSGHSGASGRYKSLQDTAREFAFILDLAEKYDR